MIVASVSALTSSAQASSYYEADDYYADGGLSPSEWFGVGADALGLKGDVDRDTFRSLLEGQVAGGQLGTTRDGKIEHRPGKFLNAELDKASAENERNGLVIESPNGTVAAVQIAGLVARRIVCWAEAGGVIGVGERFGLIRFGSRVDVFLPLAATPLVAVGQTAVGGETVLAEFGGLAGTPLVRIS